ncbi:MAG: P-type conjugative transfer protein TrbG [Termitinemataceae bacterium]|nr:MAG: P-type conjugative transfer protein TrbG [Termitinemataceae bacterium]
MSKNLFKTLCLLCAIVFSACASVDVEKRIKMSKKNGSVKEVAPAITTVPIDEPSVVVVEKPIYVKQGETYRKPDGKDVVINANTKGILKPSEYSRAAVVYDYNADWVYELYTQIYRVSDVSLMPGEKVSEAPFISDSERWMLGAGIHFENGVPVQHIYVKPTETGLDASLIINTDMRVYHLILKSYKDIHMPKVHWRYPEYPDSGMPNNFVKKSEPHSNSNEDSGGVDPRFLSFDYNITYSRSRKPRWLPELSYDDGKKTYITLPKGTLQSEMPGIFENRSDVVNYRVAQNVIIIDKLIEKITLKLGKNSVIVQKKKNRR